MNQAVFIYKNWLSKHLEITTFPLFDQELLVDFNRYRISEFPEMEVARHNLKMNYRALQVWTALDFSACV